MISDIFIDHLISIDRYSFEGAVHSCLLPISTYTYIYIHIPIPIPMRGDCCEVEILC